VPDQDSSHWLYRLSAPQWLAAADNELAQADLALDRRALRVAVTHARRAAGMALNAVLCLTPEADWPPWGRSYMDHVSGLASDAGAPADVQAAATFLRDTPPQAPTLIQLGRPDRRPLEAAGTIITWARTESDARAR
jgi:hypothetical protein